MKTVMEFQTQTIRFCCLRKSSLGFVSGHYHTGLRVNKYCPEGAPNGILLRNELRIMATLLPVKALLRGDEEASKGAH